MKKLLLLPIALLLFNCTSDKSNATECDKINAFYNQQQSQVLKQSNPDQRQLTNIEKERQLRLKESGCN